MHSNIILELSAEQAFNYQKAILAVLSKVEVATLSEAKNTLSGAEEPALSKAEEPILSGVEGTLSRAEGSIYKEHIKTVYDLLTKLNSKEFKISNLEHQT